jgi:ketosteroid isomerase-like protein
VAVGGLTPEQLIRRPVRFTTTTRRRRKLDERVWARLPALIPISTAAILRLPRRSRIRQALVLYWVRRSYEIVNRRDFELALAAQDQNVLISWTAEAGGPIAPDLVGREFHGHEGFRRAWEAWLEAFEDLRVEPEEVSDLGDRLLIGVRLVGRGTASGVPVEQRGFTLYTFRGGKVVRQEFFVDRDELSRPRPIRDFPPS